MKRSILAVCLLGIMVTGCGAKETTKELKPEGVETIQVETIQVENIEIETWDTVPIQTY